MPSAEALDRYAELITAHGLNVQEDQVVNISTEVVHRDLAMLIAEKCYARGAKFVTVDFADSRLHRLRILHSDEASLQYVPRHVEVMYSDFVEMGAANLKLLGSEDPDRMSDLDSTRLNTVRHHLRLAMRRFYDEGVGKSKIHWCVAAAATPGWAMKVFPDEEDGDRACERLWDEIFRICRADKPNCLELWAIHNETLHRRAQRLTDMGIRELHFEGPGTDLRVGLSEHAIFRGGSETSSRGRQFEANLPTEEVFTTPDCRLTQGIAQTTRPFMVYGKMVEDLRLQFENGTVTDFEASKGADMFREYIDSDEGGRRLGEVALVGIDSPVYRSGLVFHEILFDENAACHIAVGSAYKFCLRDGESLTSEQAAAIGCNESTIHTDMMISSEDVSVTAHTRDGADVRLIERGEWTEPYR